MGRSRGRSYPAPTAPPVAAARPPRARPARAARPSPTPRARFARRALGAPCAGARTACASAAGGRPLSDRPAPQALRLCALYSPAAARRHIPSESTILHCLCTERAPCPAGRASRPAAGGTSPPARRARAGARRHPARAAAGRAAGARARAGARAWWKRPPCAAQPIDTGPHGRRLCIRSAPVFYTDCDCSARPLWDRRGARGRAASADRATRSGDVL